MALLTFGSRRRPRGRRRLQRWFAPALLVWIVLSPPAVQPLGCASWAPRFEGRPGQTIEHRKLGYTIDWPGLGDRELRAASWRRFGMEDSDLAFRRDSPKGFLTLLRKCRSARSNAQIEARGLRFGFRRAVLLYSGPLSHLGYPGWAQTFRTTVGDRPAAVSAVTLAVGRCTFDWVLVAPLGGDGEARDAESRALAAVFESWWSSFRLDDERLLELYPLEAEGP